VQELDEGGDDFDRGGKGRIAAQGAVLMAIEGGYGPIDRRHGSDRET
jgi:hypothetical protein